MLVKAYRNVKRKTIKMQDYKKLTVWKEAHELTLKIYSLAAKFPPNERFGLTSQMTRAASSIPANIVEGASRNSQKELRSFLFNSFGSSNELEYFLLLARDINYLTEEEFISLSNSCNRVSRMIASLIKNVSETLNVERKTLNSKNG